MIKTALKIDGMMCGMCEAHINDVIRKVVPENGVAYEINSYQRYFMDVSGDYR